MRRCVKDILLVKVVIICSGIYDRGRGILKYEDLGIFGENGNIIICGILRRWEINIEYVVEVL